MAEMMGRRTIAGTAEGEITEKKSRFIAALKHVESEAEAEAFLNEQRKKYYESYTGQVWGAPQFHDLCLDTNRFSIPECVELIVTKFLTL